MKRAKLVYVALTVSVLCLPYYFLTSMMHREKRSSKFIAEAPNVDVVEQAQFQHSLTIENRRSNIASMDSKTSTRGYNKPKSTILRHEYKGTVLVSTRQNTEIVSAFFDFRQGQRMVAILGCQYQKHHAAETHYYCLVQYPDGGEKCLTKETFNEKLSAADENSSKRCLSHRFACTLEDSNILPIQVILSASSTCESPRTEWMDILDSRYENYTPGSPLVKEVPLGVCFQSPLYQAASWKREVIVEAVERYRVLGAKWFTLYYRENPSIEVMQVIQEYETLGLIEAINMTVSELTYYDLRYYGELLAIRDCVYRNMHRVKYLAMTDIDEVIVPQSHTNIIDMVSSIDSSKVGAFQFKHSAMMTTPGKEQYGKYTCPNSSVQVEKPKFVTNTYRTKPFPIPETVGLGRWKFIVKPQNVDMVSIHSVARYVGGYNMNSVAPTTGLLYHYRNAPFFSPDICKSCAEDSKLSGRSDLLDIYITSMCSNLYNY